MSVDLGYYLPVHLHPRATALLAMIRDSGSATPLNARDSGILRTLKSAGLLVSEPWEGGTTLSAYSAAPGVTL